MRNIQFIKPDEVILCPTFEIFVAVKSLNPYNGVKDYRWDKHKELTCYNPNPWGGHGSTISANHVKDKVILDYKEFIGNSFKVEKTPNGFKLKPNPLHKDTDLGYFAGLAMQGYISAGSNGMPDPDMIAQYAMEAAKELIKQLNKERK